LAGERTGWGGNMHRPNILWIVTTQWRAQALGCVGDANARTPCLDALAAQGVNFTQAVTPHPFGPFARAALFTGVASPENGVGDYFDALPKGTRTIAHEMAARGYATAFFGKWGVGRRDPHVPLVGEAAARVIVPEGERGGFEFWEGFEGGFLLNDPWLHGSRLEVPQKFFGYQSEVVGARAAEWMAEGAWRKAEGLVENRNSKIENGSPRFCVVSLEAPHPPYDTVAAGVEALRPEALVLPANVPRGGETEAKARRELAGYYAHIEATDRAVGRLLDDWHAQAPARADNTIVVFTSVHGDMHGAHGLFRKGWPHEESVRVPLLVRDGRVGSERAGGEKKDGSLVSLVDLPAMTLAWADGETLKLPPVALPSGMQRISMPSVVTLPHQCDRAWRGVRTPSRKLVLNADGSPWLYFDLESDPGEMANLVGDPKRSAEMAALARLA
jgi:arylsulfatase A-like enzyme